MENRMDMMDNAFKEALNTAYSTTEVRMPPYDLPRGIYMARIDKAYLHVANRVPPAIGLMLDFIVVGGDYDGCLVKKHLAIKPEMMVRLRQLLATLQVEFDGNAETLGSEEFLSRFKGLVCEIYAYPGNRVTKTGRAYINVTVRRLTGLVDKDVF